MAGREPEDRVRFPMIRQGWRDVSFLHWPYEADVVQALLPDGFSVDLFDGVAWVSLTPFRVERSRLALTPPLPGASGFPETILRTYVTGPDGRDGLWFLTLEADCLPIVAAATGLVNVPYRWSRMHVATTPSAPCVTYTSERRADPSIRHRITVETGHGPPGEADALVNWLTGRWRAWTRRLGRPLVVSVEHPPWPLETGTVLALEETLTDAVGLPPPADDPLVHTSPGVDVALSWPRRAP